MFAYRTEIIINQNGSLKLETLPFTEGDKVEVIILRRDELKTVLKKKRTTGEYVGKIRMSKDFSAPLPDKFWLDK